MKKRLTVLLILFTGLLLAQHNYPTPPDAKTRLFYIQHSNNHNTFVYDANLTGKKLNTADPVAVYRLTYTKGGIKEELSNVQRKMAYGVTVVSTEPGSCSFTLAAYPEKKIYVHLEKDGKPEATVTVNGKNILLNKMFLLANKLGTTVEYIDFYGKDTATGKEVKERMYIKG